MLGFSEVVVVDFEFSAPAGERPRPICLVAHELVSKRKFRLFEAELHGRQSAPYPTDRSTLFVSYYASAEVGCHLALEWALPMNVFLDLFTEFRNKTNGLAPSCGNGLLGAMVYHGLDVIAAGEKDSVRKLALRGGPWSDEECHQLLDYCESDVIGLSGLLDRMLPGLDLPRALLRGRYMVAAARMEHCGVPVDTATLSQLRQHWKAIQAGLIERIDANYGAFEGGTFRSSRWAQWLAGKDIAWPRLESGALALDDDTFREMARLHPELEPMRGLRHTLSQMRLEELAIGEDGRNRCLLSAFRSRTGRNQPSNTKFIFGPAVWLRNLIQSEPGNGLAYVDWAQQEFGIAAYLSGDENMISAYESGDPYLEFAKQAGAIPAQGSRATHGPTREQFKACALGVLYGMAEGSLARRIGQSPAHARELLQLHRETFPRFRRWSDAAVDRAMLRGSLNTVFGWTVHVGADVNPRSLRNFPMQANGAEMLRLACCLATEKGISVCGPVHDAILIESPAEELDAAVVGAQEAMAKASAMVLNGRELRSEAKAFQYPERYQDERGCQMWEAISDTLSELRISGAPCFTSFINNVPPETRNTPITPNAPNSSETPANPKSPRPEMGTPFVACGTGRPPRIVTDSDDFR